MRLAGLLLALVYLALAWPGAGERGVIAEEVTPSLPRYPQVLGSVDAAGELVPLPPHERPDRAGWIATPQWPQLAWRGESRDWPVLIKGHQSALGAYPGLAFGTALGGGVAGVRRTSVLLGLGLVLLVLGLGRRLGLRPGFAAAAALAAALSPGLLFFSRTGYGFELTSRVLMLLALWLAAPPRPPGWRRSAGLGLVVAAAIASRATIAATLLPALALLLVHPARRGGWLRPLLTGGLGLGLPVLAALALQALVALADGTAPAARLPLEDLADRTAAAPAYLAAQLAWVVDPRGVLGPLIAGTPLAGPAPLPLLLGLGALAGALVAWWRGRAGEAACLFVAAALGNALAGAWLYGDPQQFQLGMALEPLFLLAAAELLQDLRDGAASRARPRLAAGLLALALAGRALQAGDLLAAERRTANPMLSGSAQRALLAALRAAEGEAVTTTYNHVGIFEAWSEGQVRPTHAYRLLRRGDPERARAAWAALLRERPVRAVVLTAGGNPFEGDFTDNAAVRAALLEALAPAGLHVAARQDFACESGDPCLSLWRLAPAAP